MGLEWPGMECANNSCLAMTSLFIRLTGRVPQPPDSVPPQEVSHASLTGEGQQLGGGGAVWAAVEAPNT